MAVGPPRRGSPNHRDARGSRGAWEAAGCCPELDQERCFGGRKIVSTGIPAREKQVFLLARKRVRSAPPAWPPPLRPREYNGVITMGIFRRKVPSHWIPIHPDNARKKDWVVLLEAGTIVGPSPERLRVAHSTLERKVVRKFNILLRAKHFLVVDGYDPRIHALYFCPQLYKYDPDKKLVPLQGEEIGRLIAQALESGVRERRPWYGPSEKTPDQPIISTQIHKEFDTVVVDMSSARNSAATGS
jgi:hypothetical protein